MDHKVKKSPKFVLGSIALCDECQHWRGDNGHTKETGHTTHVEITTNTTYEFIERNEK